VLAIPSGAATGDALRTEKTLTLDAAIDVATTALARCRKDGYTVTVTVLDRSARTKVVLHDDGANPHTIENSLRKAYTALTYREPSGAFGKRITANPAAAGVLHLDKVSTSEGGLPLVAGKEVVGAVGVSGAPGGDKDAVCGQAGIDRLAL
jgi:uncharacterized protein GlcG (DUF336 family)